MADPIASPVGRWLRAPSMGLALLAFTLGCAHRVTIEPPAPALRAVTERLPALLVESIDHYKGSYYDLGTDFMNWVVMELRRTGTFAAVFGPEDALRAPHHAVRLRVVFHESFAQHWGPNVARAIAVGMSLLVLVPVISFETGYEVKLTGQLETCDGWTKDFAGAATGELRYKLFLTDRRRGWRVLTSGVTERALEGALDEIARDEEIRVRVESLAREGEGKCTRKEVVP